MVLNNIYEERSQTRAMSARREQANGSRKGTLSARNGGDEEIVESHVKT